MKWNEVFCNTFKSIGREIGLDVQMVEEHLTYTPLDPDDPRYSTDFILPSMKMVDACRADAFDFFQPFIDAGRLTVEQMHHAAERYFLGKTKSGQPIFWMIDNLHRPLDAHIGDGWLSTLLKRREPLIEGWRVEHSLFGLHLVNHGDWHVNHGDWHNDMSSVATYQGACPRDLHRRNTANSFSIVESEASAVVLSALFPETIWMAYATTSHLSPDLFAPLQGRTVTIYPHTDPTLSTYLFFEELATLTRRLYHLDLRIDTTLEDHATASQKARCIDILEFLIDSL